MLKINIQLSHIRRAADRPRTAVILSPRDSASREATVSSFSQAMSLSDSAEPTSIPATTSARVLMTPSSLSSTATSSSREWARIARKSAFTLSSSNLPEF